MRYPEGHKDQTRERILDAAVKVVFERGFKRASVQRIMKEAGLTVGGFYAHFESKEDLLQQAVLRAFRQGIAPTPANDQADLTEWDRFNRFIQTYLSRTHRDQTDGGCPLAALLTDVARDEPATRKMFERGLRAIVDALAPDLETLDDFPAQERAIATIALAAGGIALARAVENDAYSRKILKACRDFARRRNEPS